MNLSKVERQRRDRFTYIFLFLIVMVPTFVFTVGVNLEKFTQPTTILYYWLIVIYIAMLTVWYARKIQINFVFAVIIAFLTYLLPFTIWISFAYFLWRSGSLIDESELNVAVANSVISNSNPH